MLRAQSPHAHEKQDAVSLTQTLLLLDELDGAVLSTTCPIELRRRCLAALAAVLGLPLVVDLGDGGDVLVHDSVSRRPDASRAYAQRLGRKGLPARVTGRTSDRTSMIASAGASVRACDAIFDAREWAPYAALLREAALRDPVFASTHADGSLLLLHRPLDRPALTEEEANLVRLFLGERSRRVKSFELPAGARLEELTPRLRVTLGWLLRGAAEKEIASHLGLSVHTVHQYVKALYRVHGVSSRPQLMARCLRT
jgi:DNA-binding CsgD family transcriptional regulator